MKRYNKYIPTQIQWIKEIPADWVVMPLKRLAKICNGQDHKGVWDENGEYPILGSGGCFGRSNQYLHEGPSVLLGRKGTIDKPQFIEQPFWSVDTAYYTNIYPVILPKLFFYLTKTIDFKLYKTGSAVPSMTQEDLNNIAFTVSTNLTEQTQIAQFLDKKTSQIDKLIEQKEKLLKLLTEKRTALITQAVTKGLDPTVEMKDSGVDWLGDVPAHWDIIPLKFQLKSLNKKRIPLSSEERGPMSKNYPYYGASGIIDYVEDFIFEKDLILIAEDGANLLSRSTPLAFVATGKYWVNNHAHILESDSKTFGYWSNLLCIIDFTPWISGAAQPKLTQENLGSIHLPRPTEKEQLSIAEFVTNVISKFDPLIYNVKCSIDKLKEYREALITSAVTGQIDVRKET